MSVPAPLLASFPNLPIGVALIGACFGSFLNLVAWRLPREESILLPPSHCPHCGSRLRWYENVPVLGWLWLRGRCGHCGAPIAIRYPLVELLSAGLWVACLQATPAAMGPRPLAWLVVLAVFGGAVVGSIGRLSGRLGRHEPFPFGPFLAAGGAAVWLWGHDFWLPLLGLVGPAP